MARHSFIGTLTLATLPALLLACSGGDAPATDTASGMSGASTTTAAPVTNADDLDDRVERALEADTSLQLFGLDADDKDGRLVLKGRVRSAEQAAMALQVATGVAAGTPIDNRIRIDAAAGGGARPVDVDEVEDRVEDALEADSALKDLDLDVDEDNGTLVIEGTVKTAAQRTAIEELARRIAGTVTVVNRVKM
jgi:osmotically-inducible protein OsmY